MDHITVKEYVMVYFHTLTAEHNHLDSNFLKNLHDIVDHKSVRFLCPPPVTRHIAPTFCWPRSRALQS